MGRMSQLDAAYDEAAHEVMEALNKPGIDLARKLGILEVCKHILLAEAVERAGGIEQAGS